MKVDLGIDVGGSTTKIVGLNDDEIIGMLQVRAADQVTSMYGAIGNFLREHDIGLDDVSGITLTGVGATFISEQVYGIKTRKIDEFKAVGNGALHLTGLKEALVVSMGTGTVFVRAGSSITHLGGTGVGGGTILGLASQMIGKSDIDAVLALASSGASENVDLLVRDIISGEIDSLPPNLTAANFGKIKSTASESDIALGIINMVFETIGMMAVFALRNDPVRDVVLTGMLASFPQAEAVFAEFHDLTGLNFIIPRNAVFATALGACL